MVTRTFLGYHTPFLPALTAHLLLDRENLPTTLIITPTSQSGRILRESLAATATALLAPTVSTPGALLRLDSPTIAPTWLEKIAWIETLEALTPTAWAALNGLFPTPPESSPTSDWAISLAGEITTLRTTLQDHLHNLFSASKFLTHTPEAARWENLATLETLAERKLTSWGYTSRSTALRTDFSLPGNFQKIILAGVTEIPPCLEAALQKYPGTISCIIAAPESEAAAFSPLGIPSASWATRPLAIPPTVSLCADTAQQAQTAIHAIALTGAPSSHIALGSADDHTGTILSRLLSENGWSAFHPAASPPLPALVRWLRIWKAWLTKPSSANLAALLSLPESSPLIGGYRAQRLSAFNTLRDNHPTALPAQLATLANPNHPELATAITSLLTARDSFLSLPFHTAISAHLTALHPSGESAENSLSRIDSFLESARQIFPKLRRTHTFWLQTLIAEIPTPPAQPPADRAIDVQGWLELLYEPGPHLIICGMNESFVPASTQPDPWLSEKIRLTLGLLSAESRHARDAYLLHAMLQMRASSGSAHLICGKNGPTGETYLPSRLFFQVPRPLLIPIVKNLFQELEPPESNLTWKRDFTWQPPTVAPRQRISITSLTDYLACPFRFYLKHLVGMKTPDPDRLEMNHRDFGSITHLVLETWGNDTSARHLTDPTKLTSYLTTTLNQIILEAFGKTPPLPIRIQISSIHQRLTWFAFEQATIRANGWEIIEIEKKITIPSFGFTLSGKIDRIDRHRTTGQLRVIDYKTGKTEPIETAHRTKITSSTTIPAHFTPDSPPFQSLTDPKGKPSKTFWKNLQLPLYAFSEPSDPSAPPTIPAFIHLGKTAADVKLSPWDSFSSDDLTSAIACAHWITTSIAEKKFHPPSEKVPNDDYAILSQGRHLSTAFAPIA